MVLNVKVATDCAFNPHLGIFLSIQNILARHKFSEQKLKLTRRKWVLRVVATVISFLDVTIGVIPLGPTVFRAHLHAVQKELVMKDQLSLIGLLVAVVK